MKIKAIELVRPINLDYIFGITGSYTVSKLDNHIFDMSETNKGYMVLYKGQKAFIPESNVAAVLFEEEKTEPANSMDNLKVVLKAKKVKTEV